MTAAGDAMDRPPVEQRLIDALRSTDRVEPSPDLWSRVVHSIDEDTAHRRRVRITIAATLGTLAALIAAGWLALEESGDGVRVQPAVLEILRIVAFICLIATLGPAIRRFGRNYADDLWRNVPHQGTALLRLLDIAYYLVFAGWTVMAHDAMPPEDALLAEQLEQTIGLTGGLLVIMGLLHAATVMLLPFVALISNSTRAGKPLPKWLNVILIVGAIWVGAQLVFAIMGVFAIGLGG
jgi:hypothetical protein